jgi:hypothetical protein
MSGCNIRMRVRGPVNRYQLSTIPYRYNVAGSSTASRPTRTITNSLSQPIADSISYKRRESVTRQASTNKPYASDTTSISLSQKPARSSDNRQLFAPTLQQVCSRQWRSVWWVVGGGILGFEGLIKPRITNIPVIPLPRSCTVVSRAAV